MRALEVIGWCSACILVLAVVVGIIYVVGLKRVSIAIAGKPTPEEARVKIEKAQAKSITETRAVIQEVRSGSMDQNISLGRSAAERGRADRLRRRDGK